MVFARRVRVEWRLRSRSLILGGRTLAMGILNVTPDSFSDGGRFRAADEAVEAGLAMLEDGAAIVDVGGESTRPGAAVVPAAEELGRVLPVIEGILAARPEAVVSIDTYKAEVARAAVSAGAEIVNDVSGFLWDGASPGGGMAGACAELGCGVVLMHTRGRPGEWRSLPRLAVNGVAAVVRGDLGLRLEAAVEAGVPRERIVLDPGLGFGKAYESNYSMIAGLPDLRALGRPLLVGVSRKSFLGRTLAPLYGGVDVPAEGRGNATIAAVTAAILAGAEMVRVHDVRAAVEAAAIADAVLAGAGDTLRLCVKPVIE